MNSAEIRAGFIEFFKEKGHTYVHSSPCVAVGDPTLMFTNAGMNQFKEIFLGAEKRSYSRAVNSQKCIRVSGKHNDLEEVGRDGTHHTFFEMLGNWSFGDYYKRDAITWAWELLTGRWGLDKSRLYATIFTDDDEAESLWKEVTDIDHSRIVRFPEKYNFWEMGDTGPCGPCTEIHYDKGAELSCGPDCRVNCDCGRFVEIWNLVFIQYNRTSDGTLTPLVHKHVDTGMGLERITSIINRVPENYDTDLFTPLFDRIAELTGTVMNQETRTAYRVIGDHIRMLTFAIGDGAVPSNEGRGYVVRRILRRAVRFANLLKEDALILHQLVDTVVAVMGGFFTELKGNPAYIREVIRSEEERFKRTLKQGNELFEKITAGLKAGDTVAGTDIFALYDTFGFPTDLVALMARERNLKADMAGFEAEMERQKERSRAGARQAFILPPDLTLPAAVFKGYQTLECDAKVLYADQAAVVTDTTVCYAESGGQKGDRGTISGQGFTFEITDTRREKGVIVHIGEYRQGTPPAAGTAVTITVNAAIRAGRQKNHTAAHLLHHVLRDMFGAQVRQQGSMVDTDRFTFDFTFPRKLTDEERTTVEDRVNDLIRRKLDVKSYEIPLVKAKETGIIALFDEKYGETVRVIDVGDGLSRELCGGTHVSGIADIGYFTILSEEAISAGNRRIEACTGESVVKQAESKDETIRSIENVLKQAELPFIPIQTDLGHPVETIRKITGEWQKISGVTGAQESMLVKKMQTTVATTIESYSKLPDGIEFHRNWWRNFTPGLVGTTVEYLIDENKALAKELEKQSAAAAGEEVDVILKNIPSINGAEVLSVFFEDRDNTYLETVLAKVQEKRPDALVILASSQQDKAAVLCAAGPGAVNAGFKAGDIVRAIGKAAGGGGGGKPAFARGGGGDPEKVKAMLADVKGLLSQ